MFCPDIINKITKIVSKTIHSTLLTLHYFQKNNCKSVNSLECKVKSWKIQEHLFIGFFSLETLFKFSFTLFQPITPFFDGFFSFFPRTRRFEIQSSRSRIAQTHFGKKPRLQIFRAQQINQFFNRIFGKFSAFSCKFFLFHFVRKIVRAGAPSPVPPSILSGKQNIS